MIENISGGVRARHVGGNADLRATGPILALGSIGGNLTLADFVVTVNIAGQIHGQINDLPTGTSISGLTIN